MSTPELGIASRIVARRTPEANLGAVAAHGLRLSQYDLAGAGLSSLPEAIAPDLATRIGAAAAQRGIRLVAVTGTFNMIHPDIEQRDAGLRGLHALAGACGALGTRTITLCSGTFDPDDMWQRHPDNRAPEAWAYLLDSLERAIDIADEFDVQFAIQPSTANVVSSAFAARRLLHELRSPRLKILIDPTTLLRPGDIARQDAVLDDAFDLLGDFIVLAHAQDVVEANGTVYPVTPGAGALDYSHYLSLLGQTRAPLIIPDLAESLIPFSLAFLRAMTGESAAHSAPRLRPRVATAS